MGSVPSPLRSLSLGLVAIALGFLAPLLADGHAIAAPAATPTHNTAPGRHFVHACSRVSTAKPAQDRCDSAAVAAFDKVRAGEGVGPLTLPGGFDVMPAAEQLLVISNLERADRGLRPVAARVTQLDSLARYGAAHNQDPPFPSSVPSGAAAVSLWAGAGTSALLDDFYWMYDDGPGSFNEDCQHPGDDGCWGHRDDVLGARTKPLLMGAAVAYHTRWGTSMTEEFIGHDTSDKADVTPRWATIARTMAPGPSATHRTVTVHDAKVHNTAVVVRSYSHATLRAKVTSGSAYWSVTPRSCHAAASKTCALHLHFHSAKAGTHDGVLRITGPGGSSTMKLVGHRR
jgi:hypothetical protein